MSERNDKSKKPLKDNAGYELTPPGGRAHGHAPRGSVGQRTPGANVAQAQPEKSAFKQNRPETQRDERLAFKETDDKEVDRFYSRDHKMIPRDRQKDGPGDGHER